jgi:S-adenosyl methyltransferase
VPAEADPAGLIARLHAPFPAGTHVAISHGTADVVASVQDKFAKATEQLHPRSSDEVAALIAGLDLVPPGLVWLPEWRPEPGDPEPEDPAEAYFYALVARKS